MRLRDYFLRSFVKLATYGLLGVTALIVIDATTPTVRGDFDECFNPHTAQVFVADDARCTENPYQ